VDDPANTDVELGEDAMFPHHMVHGPSVQNPSVGLRIRAGAELGEDALLADVNAATRRRKWSGGAIGSRRSRGCGRDD
jgi:hypothetical protein